MGGSDATSFFVAHNASSDIAFGLLSFVGVMAFVVVAI